MRGEHRPFPRSHVLTFAQSQLGAAGPHAPHRPSRRELLALLAAAGIGTATFRRALAAQAASQPQITDEMIEQAAWISGLEFTPDERKLMLRGIRELVADFDRLRRVKLDNAVPPALSFFPRPPACGPGEVRAEPIELAAAKRPARDDDLAFLPLVELAALVRSRQISSVELTWLYLTRLKRYDPLLHCVITLLEDDALRQAERADRELAAGYYRGPLHGIPWGAKDLLAYPGHPTTWGARPYRDQVRTEKATAIARLEQAGAVLVAKLSVGALAWGDVWFGGKTRNPWNPEQGSSGSSAGSAAATAGGLVGFALGTETWGSIVSPCTRCGATGLRPTFGRVSRFGCMALAWSMDKIGPIARSVEDCALIFAAICGADGLDPMAVDRPFVWPHPQDVRTLRVGFVEAMFDDKPLERITDARRRARARRRLELDRAVLAALRQIGLELVPIELPDAPPIDALALILTAEASTAFDELTRSGRDDKLVRQVEDAWPNVLRQGQLIPAVEYLRANRIRTLLIRRLEQAMRDVDAFVAPSFAGSHLLMTNLTGHPAVVLPNGFLDDRTPSSITFTGRLYGESALLAVAHAYQQATDWHLRRPPATRSSPRGPAA